MLSFKTEKHLEILFASAASNLTKCHLGLGQTRSPPSTPKFSTSFPSNPPSIRRHFQPSLQQEQDLSHLGDKDLEEKALSLAIQEMREESGQKWSPWAVNGCATRIGKIVLIVDSNTVVLEDC